MAIYGASEMDFLWEQPSGNANVVRVRIYGDDTVAIRQDNDKIFIDDWSEFKKLVRRIDKSIREKREEERFPLSSQL